MNTMNIGEVKCIGSVLLNAKRSEAFKFNYILLNTSLRSAFNSSAFNSSVFSIIDLASQ